MFRATRDTNPTFLRFNHWFIVTRKTINTAAPIIQGSRPATKPARFVSVDIFRADGVGIILEDVGKFVSGGTGIFRLSSQANICNALYMLGLWEHVERLYALYFIDFARAQNVQVTR